MGRTSSATLTAVLGPTNTGKTHLAVERMCGHASGMIGFPLRLLAREVYDRVVRVKGAAQVALITGEEKILPPGARYFLCTAESMPTDREVSFLAIDEAQTGADPERGHVFTDRLLHARGYSETMILGSDSLRPLVSRLLPDAEIVSRPRFSTLSYTEPKKLSRLPRRSAIVAFSAEEVYAIAEMLRRYRGGAAVVMGALSPRTRNAQVAMYQAGEVDYLVATDAIGMGLNMDVGHVAFAGLGKFDGHRRRRLTVSEMAQIAGRAGRHQRDGSFGTVQLGQEAGAAFEVGEIDAIEAHVFPPLERLYWRNARLDWSSPAALIATLETPAGSPHLRLNGEDAIDLAVLRRLAQDPLVRGRARSPEMVRRLWAACGLPDYRKTGAETHSRLVGAVFGALSDGAGHLPTDWIAREVARLDNVQGDIAALSDRIAGARTWTYIAHRPDWLADPGHWAERTRAVEDRLSDALHERLMQRFVDRRTTVLMRDLGGKAAALGAEVDADGTVAVAGEEIGRLDGFRFTVDPAARHGEKRLLLAAAERHLRTEFDKRGRELAESAAVDLALVTEPGKPPAIAWKDGIVARLAAGRSALDPKIELDRALEPVSAALRQQIAARLHEWQSGRTAELLRPLLRLAALAAGKDCPAAVRGLAVRLIESLGVAERHAVADLIDGLDRAQRQILARAGVRIGTLDIFVPALLKPEATRWRLALHAASKGHVMPDLPPPGAVLLKGAGPALAIAGFRRIGDDAVRIDIIERLARAAHDARNGRSAFLPDPALATSIGLSPEGFRQAMRLLGFVPAPGEADGGFVWRGHRKPARRKAVESDSGGAFAVLAMLREGHG